jgi:hypothetical protein
VINENNAIIELGFIKEARDKVLEVIKYFEENSGDMEMICNSEGFIINYIDFSFKESFLS